ncbi:MAG: DUF4255 domain-containing protein [Terracidiphilus sp.]
MSSVLAIAAVSAVLEYYLNNAYNGLSAIFGDTVTVSAKAPDLVQTQIGTGSTLQNQVNLFLHQVKENAAWRNVGQPWVAADGITQLKNPPLALDLHYLLTAYGSNDWQAEALLGYALLMLHENPVMTRQDIRNAFDPVIGLPATDPGNLLSSVLGTSGLADQIEMIKITPSTMGREEMAWIWTALKADYRPTYAFQVSVVLMQQAANVSLAFPVLHRRIKAKAVTPAQILEIDLPQGQLSAAAGDTVKVKGEFLAGASQVSLTNARLAIEQTVNVSPIDNNNLSFVTPGAIPAGIYSLAVLFNDTTGNTVQSTGSLPFAVAPVLQTLPPPVAAQSATNTQVTIIFSPNIVASQSATLTLNSFSATAGPVDASTNTLQFTFTPALQSGSYLARLTVDGAPSVVGVNWNVHPPVFTGPTVNL